MSITDFASKKDYTVYYNNAENPTRLIEGLYSLFNDERGIYDFLNTNLTRDILENVIRGINTTVRLQLILESIALRIDYHCDHLVQLDKEEFWEDFSALHTIYTKGRNKEKTLWSRKRTRPNDKLRGDRYVDFYMNCSYSDLVGVLLKNVSSYGMYRLNESRVKNHSTRVKHVFKLLQQNKCMRLPDIPITSYSSAYSELSYRYSKGYESYMGRRNYDQLKYKPQPQSNGCNTYY